MTINIKLIFEEGNDYGIIVINEDSWKKIHPSIFGKKNPFPSTSESKEEWNILFYEMEYKLTKNFVLRRLSLKSYYSKQIEKLLNEKLVSTTNIKRIIQEFCSLGYLNDEDWLNAFMRGHIKRYSLKMIYSKLKARNVAEEDINRTVSQWKNPEQELSSVSELIRKKYKNRDFKNYKEKQKVIAALFRKGYSFELIQTALKQFNLNFESNFD